MSWFQPEGYLGTEAEAVSDTQKKAYEEPPLPSSFNGPRPFCRICKRGVDDWAWDHYSNGSWGVSARCHGDRCGHVFAPSFKREYWIEAFCDEEPRIKGTRIWFVWQDGQEIQPSPDTVRAMTVGNLAVMNGKFGKFIRSKQTLITIIMIGAGLLMRMMH